MKLSKKWLAIAGAAGVAGVGIVAYTGFGGINTEDNSSKDTEPKVEMTDLKMPFGQPIPKEIPPEVRAAVSKAPAPDRMYPDKNFDPANDDRFVTMTFNIKTNDDRDLSVSAYAYCEQYETMPEEEYMGRCGQYVKLMLDFHAQNYSCFEGAVPAQSSDVRNHEGLADRKDPLCSDKYPENKADYTPENIRTSVELTKFQHNYYTVTKIKPL